MITFRVGLLAIAIRISLCSLAIDDRGFEDSMAPRARQAAAGGAKGTKKAEIVKPKKTTALAEDWPNKVDRWKGKPKAFCRACEQNTSTIDKHSHPEKPSFLHWVHSRISKAEQTQGKSKAKAKAGAKKVVKEEDLRYPSGEECYTCFDVRRKWYTGLTLDQLLDKRKDDSSVDDAFNEYRHDSASGEHKFKGQKAKQINTVEKGTSEFGKDYVAGTFERLDVFAANRRIKYETESQLVAHIEETYPHYKVVVKKDGAVFTMRLYRGPRAQA
jgi:ribosomal protein L44E